MGKKRRSKAKKGGKFKPKGKVHVKKHTVKGHTVRAHWRNKPTKKKGKKK